MERASTEIQTLTHDINNKLTVIVTAIDLIMRKVESGVTKEKVIKSLKKLKDVSNDIIEICQDAMAPQEGRDINLLEVINKEISRYEELLKVEVIAHKKPIIKSNSSKLKNMITNILKNAHEAKATKLLIEIRPPYIIFRDNGGGIPNEILFKLNKGEEATTKGNGHGIGVCSISKFCTDQGWTLNMENGSHILDQKGKMEKGLITRVRYS